MPKKKVLILGKLPPPYMGPAIATEIILNSSLGETFDLIHLDTRINDSLDSMGRWSFRKIFRSTAVYIEMFRKIRTSRPDLVLIPFSQDTVPFLKDSIFIFIAKLFGRRVLLHLRGSNFLGWISKTGPLTRWYIKRVITSTDGVIVLGDNLRYLFKNYFPSEKIFTVPNGANYILPVADSRDDDPTIRILYLANLQASKGIEDVLMAIAELKQEHISGFKLSVVGTWRDESFKNKCLDIVNKNMLPVEFFPSQNGQEKFRTMVSSNIFVFTPRAPEGHPWVIVEALASSLPVITTNQGAIVESVIDGKNGFVVSANAPGEIAGKIKLLINDQALRKQMSAESRNIYLANLTEEKMTNRLSAAFNALIA